MMMRYRLAAALLCLAGCAKPLAYEAYREATGAFSANVPIGWPRDFDDAFSRRPIAAVSWIGKQVDGNSGRPIGAVLEVKRLTRWAADHLSPKDFERFQKDVVASTDDLFLGKQPKEVTVEELTLAGKPARRYGRDLEQTSGGGLHGDVKRYPSRVEGVVIQTPEAYFVLEYRATKELFDTYRPAFEKLTSTFALGAGTQ